MQQNIKYTADEIEEFYRDHRVRWDQFYDSERVMMERIGINEQSSVLDIGCGCAGLGLALKERFGTNNYTGVEINVRAAETARVLYPEATIFGEDILAIPKDVLKDNSFDYVFSFSCIDWNTQFVDMMNTAYSYVRPGGFLIASFRLTPHATVNDMQRSYQYINFNGRKEGETAPYVVMNVHELIDLLKSLKPQSIRGYGYWGTPSTTAVSPYDRLCFAVIAVQKPVGDVDEVQVVLDLPSDVVARPE